ncbi:MAG: pentapeptide repeat-containing protein [Cyanobacteria bacterium J06649_4]
MNYRLAIGICGIAFACFGAGWAETARAENPEHMRQLLTTGDCPGCDLSETSITDIALQGANLQGANLRGTHLRNVDLTRANLSSANLSGTRLNSANLTGANLQAADLSDAISSFSCNGDSNRRSEDIESCVISFIPYQVVGELCIEDAELAEAMVEALYGDGADTCAEETITSLLRYSTYTSSVQRLTRPLLLRGANLRGANLQNSDFSGADFSYAMLADTEAAGTNFSYARLFDTDVVGLVNADLTDAWDSWERLHEWMIAKTTQTEEEALRLEGATYAGAMNRAQQAYHLDQSQFTTDLPSLGLGIDDENEHYSFGILEIVSGDDLPVVWDRQVIQYALSKSDELPSFLGVVFAEDESASETTTHLRTRAMICESDSTEVLAVDDIAMLVSADGLSDCPDGWTPMR